MPSIIEGYNYDIRLLRQPADTADTSLSASVRRRKGRNRERETRGIGEEKLLIKYFYFTVGFLPAGRQAANGLGNTTI